MKPVIRRRSGFTLIELAVVLAIFGLLLGMMVIPLSTQVEQQRIAETERQLAAVREALIGFAIANGRLPCPAVATAVTGTAGAGTERAVCGFGAEEGVLPWVTLGVPETDAWGRRLTYRVTPNFADAPGPGMQASFLINEAGNIRVTDGVVDVAVGLPAVVVSHGKNGLGAFRSDGVQNGGALGGELANANNNTNFVSRGHGPDFDDILVWVSPHLLKSRMVAANRLP